MECSEVRIRLDDYLRGTLPVLEAKAVESHLENCSECFDEANMLKELNEVLDEEGAVFAGKNFTAKVMEAVFREKAREKRFSFPYFSIINLGASLVLAGLLTIFINIPYVNGMVEKWSDSVHYRVAVINTNINATKDHVGQYFKNIFIPGGN